MISFIHSLALGKCKLVFKGQTKTVTVLAFILVLSRKRHRIPVPKQKSNVDGWGERESLPSKCQTALKMFGVPQGKKKTYCSIKKVSSCKPQK